MYNITLQLRAILYILLSDKISNHLLRTRKIEKRNSESVYDKKYNRFFYVTGNKVYQKGDRCCRLSIARPFDPNGEADISSRLNIECVIER